MQKNTMHRKKKKKNDFFSLETVSWKARCDRVNVIEIFKIQVFKTNAWLMLWYTTTMLPEIADNDWKCSYAINFRLLEKQRDDLSLHFPINRLFPTQLLHLIIVIWWFFSFHINDTILKCQVLRQRWWHRIFNLLYTIFSISLAFDTLQNISTMADDEVWRQLIINFWYSEWHLMLTLIRLGFARDGGILPQLRPPYTVMHLGW